MNNNRWLTVGVAAAAWVVACLVTWRMPLATRVAVGLTAAGVLLILSVKATTAGR